MSFLSSSEFNPQTISSIKESAISKFGDRTPYSIQKVFISDFVDAFNQEKIGFFESPTGTGKSMSVLTSSISYIQEKNKDAKDYSQNVYESDIDSFLSKTNKRSKLIICTRTHSQIKELVNELKRPHMRKAQGSLNKTTRVVSLAARRHLCVNGQYINLTASELNNVCKKTCVYNKDKDKWRNFVKKINTDPMDIEDLMSYGRSTTSCPYFASRSALQCSDIILMPYQTLFQKETREALNIQLSNTYIVIDEAHNLVDALNQMNTVTLDRDDFQTISDALKDYQIRIAKSKILSVNNDPTVDDDQNMHEKRPPPGSKEEKKMDAKREMMREIQQINNYSRNIFAALRKELPPVMEMIDFQTEAKVENENPIPMIDYAREKSLVYRITKPYDDAKRLKVTTSFRKFFQFLDVSLNPDSFGRLLLDRDRSLCYMLLNPSKVFEQVLDAKSVILVGGTLQPFDDLMAQLIEPVNFSRVTTHVNGHVIPKENSLTFSLSTGPLRSVLDYTATSRSNNESLAEIGESALQLSRVIPGGMIFFFTSFAYLRHVQGFLKQSGYWNKIQERKLILVEPDQSKDLEKVMKQYKSAVDNQTEVFTGALLLAVMNGKLSEGINFQNEYCRCVVCVGLPFPNTHDRAIQERMKFFDQLQDEGLSKCNGQMFLENSCMRIVNQAIGRSFRNINDYAVALLFDQRYKTHKTLLPDWIQENYREAPEWNTVIAESTKFFSNKK